MFARAILFSASVALIAATASASPPPSSPSPHDYGYVLFGAGGDGADQKRAGGHGISPSRG